jgi:hypothetical protein
MAPVEAKGWVWDPSQRPPLPGTKDDWEWAALEELEGPMSSKRP